MAAMKWEITGTGELDDGFHLSDEIWKRMVEAQRRADEETVRAALGLWVSEEVPTVVYSHDGFMLGISSERLCQIGHIPHLIFRFVP